MESIYNFEEDFQKYGLTEETYEQMLQDFSNRVQKITDDDFAEINERYNLGFNSDTTRKATQPPLVGSSYVMEYFKWKESKNKNSDNGSYFKELQIQKQEIRKEKQKLFDERTALKKMAREDGRIEEDIAILERMIKENGVTTLPAFEINKTSSDNDLFVCLSDFHLGLNTNNYFGVYNSDVASQRLSKYLDEIIKIKKLHNSENVYLGILGDILNGDIHFTTQLENRENITEQVQKSAELISAFVYELSKNFNNVYINGVAGNHSRTSFKDQVLRGNRLDNLIPWYMKAKLDHLNNIHFIDDMNYDSTIATCVIRGNEYLMVHGDYDSYSESGVSKLVLMLKHSPTAIFYGHLHKCSYDDISGIKIIRSGCFCGTSDDYTVSKRLSGSASQMVCVVTDDGIKSLYPVYLD